MAKNKAYYEEVNMKNQLHLREILDELPPYCKQFFIGIEPTTASRTRLAYAYDLNCFFEFLHENNPICKKMKIMRSLCLHAKPVSISFWKRYSFSECLWRRLGRFFSPPA